MCVCARLRVFKNKYLKMRGNDETRIESYILMLFIDEYVMRYRYYYQKDINWVYRKHHHNSQSC